MGETITENANILGHSRTEELKEASNKPSSCSYWFGPPVSKITVCGHQVLSVLDTCWEYWSCAGFTILAITRHQALNNPVSLYIEY